MRKKENVGALVDVNENCIRELTSLAVVLCCFYLEEDAEDNNTVDQSEQTHCVEGRGGRVRQVGVVVIAITRFPQVIQAFVYAASRVLNRVEECYSDLARKKSQFCF